MEAVINYAESSNQCRSRILLSYFGENNVDRCNQCDVCLNENKKTLHNDEFEKISTQIKELLAVHALSISNLVNALTEGNEDKRIRTIQWLIDNDQLKYNPENLLVLKV
jgi:ATP-dependent DNA helicase RecQ